MAETCLAILERLRKASTSPGFLSIAELGGNVAVQLEAKK
jgi:hypothetical protein